MVIYIESFLLQNILINFCLLRLVKITLKSKSSFLRLILGSMFGAFCSVITVVFVSNNLLLNLIKLICAVGMILFSFKQSKKNHIISLILLFVFTYTLGGAVTSLASKAYSTNIGIVYVSKFSLEAICLILIIFTYIYEKLLKYIKYKIKSNNFIYSINLHYKENSLKIDAYLDTGNLLNYEGNPVIIIDLDAYLKLTKSNLINFYLNNHPEIKTSTVNGNNGLKLVQIDQMDINIDGETKIFKNQYIAINTNTIFKDTNYQALLTPLLL